MTREPRYYPVMLDLRGRLAVVVGGGGVAEQKVRELLDAGARVRVVSPRVTPRIMALARGAALEWVARSYRPGDLRDARIAIAATDDRAVNQAIWEEADGHGVLLNAVDDVERCHYIAPSVHREGDITITVSTSGRCPALAVRLRERIGSIVRQEHAQLARLAGELRPEVARRVPRLEDRRALWYDIVDSQALDALRSGGRVAALDIVEALIRDAERGAGFVALVGAGPGDPQLITVRGRELLTRADVVVHDRLVSPLLLAQARGRLIDVGKHGHGRSTSQDAINEILVAEARRGRRVVRLKGGDPFVFGRGGEEIEFLRAAGVRYEVVPGVSSAIAAAAAADIPVTHRSMASGFAVVTAHECESARSSVDWPALARVPTLVVLMGLRALPCVVSRLVDAGGAADTPAAVISRATLPDQRIVIGTLSDIASRIAAARLAQPATLIVGEVVRLSIHSCHPERSTRRHPERSEGSAFPGSHENPCPT